jgi:hypothetical protein
MAQDARPDIAFELLSWSRTARDSTDLNFPPCAQLQGLNLRMHTGCWRTYSSHVMGYSTRVAHSSRGYSLSCRLPFSSRPRRCLQTVRSLAVLQRSIHHLSNGAHSWPWRAAVLSHYSHPCARSFAWSPYAHPRPADDRGLSDEQEDAAKAAILEKVMKGRQPTDLMLRCESILLICTSLAQ